MQPLTRFHDIYADASLARRLEDAELWGGRRFAEAIEKLDRKAKAEVLTIAGGTAVYVAPGHPLTQAIGIGLNRPVTPAEFDELEQFFFARRSVSQIVVSPFTDNSALDLMRERGYTLHHFENALYRPLSSNERFKINMEGFLLERTRPEHYESAAWVQAQCFFREQAADFLVLSWASFLIENSLSYVAWVGDKMVGATGGTLIQDLRLASLFGSSTLPGFRGRGIQRAMIEARLLDAIAGGCDLAFIGAMPGSTTQRNAERLGFRVAYSKAVMVRLQQRS